MSKRTIIIITVASIVGAISWAMVFVNIYSQKGYKNFEIKSIERSEENKPANEIEKLPSASEEVSFIAVGDISYSRGIGRAVKNKKDKSYPFANVKEILQKADFCFGNLETPITSGREIQDDEMVFRSDPGTEKILADMNFKILSLANNHTMNFGEKGITDTLNYLKMSGIEYAGAGKDISEAFEPKIVESKGIKIAFLAFNDSDVVPKSYYATDKKAGTAPMDKTKMSEAVSSAKGEADIAVVSMHSGKEYVNDPNGSQKEFAQAAIDAGADLVIGHHPHVVQTMEKYKGKYIFYSIGNFIFDQPWSEPTKEAIMLKITLNKNSLKNIIVYPVYMAKYAQPQIELSERGDEIAKRLNYDLNNLDFTKWDKDKNNFTTVGKKYLLKIENPACGAVSRQFKADIDGDGIKESYKLSDGELAIVENDKTIWRSEKNWRVDDLVLADANNDGEMELNISVWKPGNFGSSKPFWVEKNDESVKNHFFVYRMTDDKFQPLWHSSNLEFPNTRFSFFDIDDDKKNELIVSESKYKREKECAKNYLAVWRWNEWGFTNIWRSGSDKYEYFNTEIINGQIPYLLSY